MFAVRYDADVAVVVSHCAGKHLCWPEVDAVCVPDCRCRFDHRCLFSLFMGTNLHVPTRQDLSR